MGIELTEEEAWRFLEESHTAIVTTLRSDGWPVSLPTWFAVLDGGVYMRTPARSAKVRRIAADSRACLVVETGQRWRELKAISLLGRIERLDEEGDEAARAAEAIAVKYGEARVSDERLPGATRRHYADMVYLRFTPEHRISWDNAKIRLRPRAEIA